MYIFGDKHTHTHARTHKETFYDQEVSLEHGMHECCKLSHTSCTTVLSHCTKVLSDYSQSLSTSEALFTLTTLQSERGSKKNWCMCPESWPSRHTSTDSPKRVTRYHSGGAKIGCSTCKLLREIAHISTLNQAAPCDYYTVSANCVCSLKGKTPKADCIFCPFWHPVRERRNDCPRAKRTIKKVQWAAFSLK